VWERTNVIDVSLARKCRYIFQAKYGNKNSHSCADKNAKQQAKKLHGRKSLKPLN